MALPHNSAVAQTVRTVSAVNGIQAAIAASSPGDILVLGGGTYDPFVLDRGLVIRGNGATIGGGPGASLSAVTVAVPPGQIAHLDNLRFTYGYSPFGPLGCPVTVSGAVRIDRCTMVTRNGSPALAANSAQLTIVASSLTCGGTTGSGIALQATDSHIELRDSTVTGSPAGCHPVGCMVWSFPATPAAQLDQSSLHAERSRFDGGSQPSTTFRSDGASGIEATNSALWLADCVVTGGSSAAGNGATALQNTGSITAELRQTQLVAGSPGGQPSSGPLDPSAPLLLLELQPVWTRGQNSTLTMRGTPGNLFGLFLTPSIDSVSTAGIVEPVLATGAVALAVGTLDGSGNATVVLPVPAVTSLLHTPVWCQAASGIGLPLRASTMAGGLVR
ncbi:MAG: hypothetical protein JNK49_19950 [Planctomycetes bacterium]|nr:hypothetical protein [Planctomycetota bacterium]